MSWTGIRLSAVLTMAPKRARAEMRRSSRRFQLAIRHQNHSHLDSLAFSTLNFSRNNYSNQKHRTTFAQSSVRSTLSGAQSNRSVAIRQGHHRPSIRSRRAAAFTLTISTMGKYRPRAGIFRKKIRKSTRNRGSSRGVFPWSLSLTKNFLGTPKATTISQLSPAISPVLRNT